MHFSIPDTQELYTESTGTSFTGYNIYINGSYHCCLRFKQLHGLHEQLKRRLDLGSGGVQLPVFPPKRLLPLTNNQLEIRRAALEHYLQLVGQDARVGRLEYFQNFLLAAQQETAAAEGMLDAEGMDGGTSEVLIDVVLPNGYQLQVNCFIGDNASTLLRKAALSLQLPITLIQYFCLYLGRKDTRDTLLLLRKLMDFEAPIVSRRRNALPYPCQILLRKSYWSPTLDAQLLTDSISLNLIFIQTVADVEREWIIAPPDVRQKLRSLQDHGMKKEYLEMARLLPLYGCVQFAANAQIDYPEPQTSALISIGNKELSMRTAKGAKIYETKFRVTRMRCWRVTAIHNSLIDTLIDGSVPTVPPPSNLQLSFEYLMSKQSLRWITITSSQAMLMSVCLQAMVDELLTSKNDEPKSLASNYSNQTPPLSFGPRNGRMSTQSTISSSSSTPSFSNEHTTPTSATTTNTSSSSSSSSPTDPPPVRFLLQTRTRTNLKQNPKISTSQSYSAVFFRNEKESVHNEAFEGIGDDDL